jgi:hypothetical protein
MHVHEANAQPFCLPFPFWFKFYVSFIIQIVAYTNLFFGVGDGQLYITTPFLWNPFQCHLFAVLIFWITAT